MEEKEVLGRGSPGLDEKHEPLVINGEVIPDPDAGLSPEERAQHERALLWKLDLRLVPWLSLLYLASFLDSV